MFSPLFHEIESHYSSSPLKKGEGFKNNTLSYLQYFIFYSFLPFNIFLIINNSLCTKNILKNNKYINLKDIV